MTKLNGGRRQVEQRSGSAAAMDCDGRQRGRIRLPTASAVSPLTLPGSLSSVNRRPRGGRLSPAQILRSACFFISITGLAANHAQLAAQEVTSVAPPAATVENVLPATLSDDEYPDAQPLPAEGTDISIVTDPACGKESRTGNLYVADCHVVITYKDRMLEADHIEYNSDTGDVDYDRTRRSNHRGDPGAHGGEPRDYQPEDADGAILRCGGARWAVRARPWREREQGAGNRQRRPTRLRAPSVIPTATHFCLPAEWW